MKKTIYICDKCKGEIQYIGKAIDTFAISKDDPGMAVRQTAGAKHLCPDCAAQVGHWIDGLLSLVPAESDEACYTPEELKDIEKAENEILEEADELDAEYAADADPEDGCPYTVHNKPAECDEYDDIPFIAVDGPAYHEITMIKDDDGNLVEAGSLRDKDAKESPKPHGKDLDDGKMKALLQAGWSVAEIADEMNCSAPTVRKHLKAMGLI